MVPERREHRCANSETGGAHAAQYSITIDEVLILLAQLSGRKDRLNSLASRQPKERLGDRYFGSGNGPIEYRYANYDVAQAEADYRAVADEIAALQLELDLVNQTEVFSVEL